MDLFYVESYFWEFRNKNGDVMSSRYVIRSISEAQQILTCYNESFMSNYNYKLQNVEQFQAYVEEKEIEFVKKGRA